MKKKTIGIILLIIIIIILSVGAFVFINNNKNKDNNTSKVVDNGKNKEEEKKEILEKKENKTISLGDKSSLKNGTYKVNDDYTIKVKDDQLSINGKVVKKNLSKVYSKVTIVDKYLAFTAYHKKVKSNTLYLFDEKGNQIYAISKINNLKIQNNIDAVKYYDDYALITVSELSDKDFTCKGKYKKNTIEVYKLMYPTDNKYKNLVKELVDSTTIKRSDLCK